MANINDFINRRRKRAAMVTAPTLANIMMPRQAPVGRGAMPRPAMRPSPQSTELGIPAVDRSVLQQAIQAARQERDMAAGMRPAQMPAMPTPASMPMPAGPMAQMPAPMPAMTPVQRPMVARPAKGRPVKGGKMGPRPRKKGR
jgi:hypothetical protein